MHKMMVLAKAAPGRKNELATWYDDRHMVDLLKVPGLVTAERHDVIPLKRPDGSPEWDFLLIYGLDGDDPMAVIKAMGGLLGTPAMPMSDALQSASTVSLVGVSKTSRAA